MDSAVTYQVILEAIYSAIDEINNQLPTAQQLAKQKDTIILGEGGTLDSLVAIQLLVAIEEHIAASVGGNVDLMDENLLSLQDGSLQSLSSLTSFITEKLST
tara:strand:+ start:694 stop:999 length:306 start_codon:yes stop_codon:yes gene_type:complete